MTSSIPNRRYGNALRRLDAPAEALWFFDEQVLAAWDTGRSSLRSPAP